MSRSASRLLLLPGAVIFAAFLGACGGDLPTAPRGEHRVRGASTQADTTTKRPVTPRDSAITTQGNYENPLV